MNFIIVLIAALLCAVSPAIAADPQPGDACPANGAVVQTAGPEQIPGRTLICNGTVWKTVSETTTSGRSLFQIDNDTGACNADKAGRMRYLQAGNPPWQFCDGTDWVNFKQPQCADNATGECYLDAARSVSDAQFIASNIADGVNILGVTGNLIVPSSCANDTAGQCVLATTRSASDPQFVSGNIRAGNNILGVTGSLAACSNDSSAECILSPTRSTSDAQFTAANIASGVNILGVTGTLTGGLSGPSGCENIGDLCVDGTVFAGYHPITHEHLFIPTTDQGTTSAWKTSTGTNDIATDSTWDGRANTNQVANSTSFPAFKLCKDLAAGGHSDWYLPSRVELYYIWSVRDAIEAAGKINNFLNVYYWSSTEYTTNYAMYQDFGLGAQGNTFKSGATRVRCVRQ